MVRPALHPRASRPRAAVEQSTDRAKGRVGERRHRPLMISIIHTARHLRRLLGAIERIVRGPPDLLALREITCQVAKTSCALRRPAEVAGVAADDKYYNYSITNIVYSRSARPAGMSLQ
jgi:hypothetical protein